MKRIFKLVNSCLIAVSLFLVSNLATADSHKPAKLSADSVAIIATVQSINRGTRMVTLRTPDGKLTNFSAGNEVRNLEQVKKGDIVLIEYFQGLAVAVEPKGAGIRERRDELELSRAKLGEKPAASVREKIDIVATVEAIDRDARTVTVKGAERTVTLKVAEDVDLNNVDVDDEVQASYFASFAVSVKPAPKISGAVSIESKSVAAGVGFQWGKGSLTMYDGSTHKFKISGLSIIDVGISSATLSGDVYQLTDPQDFNGTYLAAEVGLALAGGGSAVTMKNNKDVVLHLKSKQKGLKVTLAPQGLSIKLLE